METLTYLLNEISFVAVVAIGIVLLLATTLIANARVKKLFDANHELVEADNLGLALRRAGLLIGLAIPISTVLSVDMLSLTQIGEATIETVIIIVLMFTSLYFADILLLPHVDTDEEIKKQNVAVGIVEFGLLIATGLVLQGSYTGMGSWVSPIVFFLLGQVILIATVKGYAKFSLKVNGEAVTNKSVAILISSYLIGMGFILRASLAGDFVSWSNDILAILIWAAIGTVLLGLLTTSIINKMFLPTTSIQQEIKDQNIAGMLYIGAIKISVAILIANVVLA